MIVRSAAFVTSVADPAKLPDDGTPEIALCGRSNVGKSSFINCLTRQKRLAKVGKDPGMTRLVNYFRINNGAFCLVDLPGYGYAKVSEVEKRKWGCLIEGYLRNSKQLKHVFLLLDVRRDPNADDILMVNYLYHYAISFSVIATKADKVSRAEANRRVAAIAAALKVTEASIYLISALDGQGRERVEQRLDEILDGIRLSAGEE